MKLEPEEIEALAEALAPMIADLLAERLEQRPEWSFSVAEAAAWAKVPEYVVRDAVADGRLPSLRIGRSIRIRRLDLFRVRGDGQQPEPGK